MLAHELAQVNIALGQRPLDAPLLADFVAALDPVNARADDAPGFVWRMQNAEGNATSVRGFGDDPRLIINVSVWESLEALRRFVYRDPEHLRVMRRRREWFHRLDLYMVLWWVPSGHRPSIKEAERRLDLLRAHGPTPAAFTFRTSFDNPASEDQRVNDGWLCPASVEVAAVSTPSHLVGGEGGSLAAALSQRSPRTQRLTERRSGRGRSAFESSISGCGCGCGCVAILPAWFVKLESRTLQWSLSFSTPGREPVFAGYDQAGVGNPSARSCRESARPARA